MSDIVRKYTKQAQSVLSRNWRGSYTIPSGSLYPHQWNWDSGFIAIGYSHFDTEKAMSELKSLFNAQWKNGMLPQIVFNENALGNYFPEPDFWNVGLSNNAPSHALTSAITMPPIHGVAALKIYENAPHKEKVISFLKWIYPRLLSLHRYFYNERQVNGDGLVYIRHPWESGMDNSPAWDIVLDRIDLSSAELPVYERKDTEAGVSADMRPTKKYYDYFVYLVELFKKNKYDEREIAKDCPFLICGPLFNAILCASNEALIKIADILKEPHDELEEWYELTARGIRDKLYHKDHGIFDALDLRENKLLELETASGFAPLFGGAASKEQAQGIYSYLNSKSFCALHQGNCFTIPSYDTQKEGFKREHYWRGPVWININWMLANGLRRYGYGQKADSLSRDILELPMRFGFYEYYDSFDGRGYGSEAFSWTASLFIDTAYETYFKTGDKPISSRVGKSGFKTRILNAGEEKSIIPQTRLSQEMLKSVREINRNYYTSEGTVNYELIKKSNEYKRYRSIAANLRDFDINVLKDENEKLAFWINLYNTIVVDGIISSGINSSVKETIGFFTNIKYDIGGHKFSPDDIEHGILRANKIKPSRFWRQFGLSNEKAQYSLSRLDPRIHFALVCGSRSCAPIKYYTPEGIDDELEVATKNFINSSEVIVIPEEKRMLVSSIFKWYSPDFGGTTGVIDFIKTYIVDDDKKEFLTRTKEVDVSYLYYDWNLNKQ